MTGAAARDLRRCPAGEPPGGEVRRADRQVAHDAQAPGGTARRRLRRGGDGCGCGAAAEELQRVVLVLAQNLQLDLVRHGRQPGQRPGVQGIAVDDQGQPDAGGLRAGLQLLGQIGGEHVQLPGEAHHRVAGGGEFDGAGPFQHRPADGHFEGADALAHRRRRDPEVARGGLEASVGHDGREGPGLVRMDIYH